MRLAAPSTCPIRTLASPLNPARKARFSTASVSMETAVAAIPCRQRPTGVSTPMETAPCTFSPAARAVNNNDFTVNLISSSTTSSNGNGHQHDTGVWAAARQRPPPPSAQALVPLVQARRRLWVVTFGSGPNPSGNQFYLDSSVRYAARCP